MRRSSCLRWPDVHDRHLASRADEEAADLLQRVLRGAQADSLHRAAGLRLQALERQREMRAALGRRDGVDLVDDHRLDATEHRARLRREHQVQRLGRRDQDVRRVARHRRALALRRVAGANRHAHVVRADATQRRAQVALDVIRQRLQRAHVHHAHAARRVARAGAARFSLRPACRLDVLRSFGAQAVKRPQERRERLARAGRRRQQHVLAGGDRRPGLRLRGRRRVERLLEPLAHAWREAGQRHPMRLARAPARQP